LVLLDVSPVGLGWKDKLQYDLNSAAAIYGTLKNVQLLLVSYVCNLSELLKRNETSGTIVTTSRGFDTFQCLSGKTPQYLRVIARSIGVI
jgi:hypothetical protein